MAPPPTRVLLPMTRVYQDGLRQDPTRAQDLDGYSEVGIYLNAQGVIPAGGTLTVRVAHAMRNRSSDFTELASWTGITSATTSWTYKDEFFRYLTAKVEWSSGAGSTAQADVELLTVAKK